jgi:hypothetical protein
MPIRHGGMLGDEPPPGLGHLPHRLAALSSIAEVGLGAMTFLWHCRRRIFAHFRKLGILAVDRIERCPSHASGRST